MDGKYLLISNIIICATIVVISILFIILFIKVIIPLIEKINDRKYEIEIKNIDNDKYKLYSSLDVEKSEEVIVSYFQSYVTDYIKYHYIAQKIIAIPNKDVEVIIKEVTKTIAINLSDLYIFYIKILRNISTDEDLLGYIHDTVTELVITLVSNYNSAGMQESLNIEIV